MIDQETASIASRILVVVVVYSVCTVAVWAAYSEKMKKGFPDTWERFIILVMISLFWADAFTWIIFDVLGLFPIMLGG